MVQQRDDKFEKEWSYMQKSVTKLIRILEREPEPAIACDEYVDAYTSIYDICNPNYSQQLYDKYREVIEDYIIQTVLPSLREKHEEYMLRELVKRWINHKVMVNWLTGCFSEFVHLRNVPSFDEVGLKCFYDLVYGEMKSKAREAVIALIHKEREGEEIDRALVKKVLDVYGANGMGTLEKYEEDFESFMLQDTHAAYYSLKASRWIQEDSSPDYMLKVEECLKREKERVTHYLHSSTEPKLVEALNETFETVRRQGGSKKLE